MGRSSRAKPIHDGWCGNVRVLLDRFGGQDTQALAVAGNSSLGGLAAT
ncbi:hypothetical protein [Streptomyces sp. B1I3]|nr:hypothetical protein [Streptomyces sp. B1I3]